MTGYKLGSFVRGAQKAANAYSYQGRKTCWEPATLDLQSIKILATSVRNADYQQTEAHTAKLNYEVVELTNTNSNKILPGTGTNMVNGEFSRGWSSRFNNTVNKYNVPVELPPTKTKISTEGIAINFINPDSTAFKIAGAQHKQNRNRNASSTVSADLTYSDVHNACINTSPCQNTEQNSTYDSENHKPSTWNAHAYAKTVRTVNSDTQQLLSLQTINSTQIIYEAGSFVNEAQRLSSISLNKGSNLYVQPTATELQSFAALAEAIWNGNIQQAAEYSTHLGYEVVQFTDTNSAKILVGIREILVNGQVTKGWGSYFINTDNRSNALIEVPHVKADINTDRIGAKSFLDTSSTGFLMAGAHRDTNGVGTADVCDLANSVFHTIHNTWINLLPSLDTWQIHGYAAADHSFPTGTDLIISNGDGTVSDEILYLDKAMQELGFLSYVYNTLDALGEKNITVNDGISGQSFSSLGGTTNVQGQASRALGSLFVHAELEQSIRLNEINLEKSIIALTKAINEGSKALAPTPATIPFTSGWDNLTGTNLGDQFILNSLTDSLLSPTPDRITNLQSGIDVFISPYNLPAAINPQQLGTVKSLDVLGVKSLLTKKVFTKMAMATFTYSEGDSLRTFLAINDAFAGFNQATDSIIEITNFSGNLNSLAII